MEVIVFADELQQEEFLLKKTHPGVEITFVSDFSQILSYQNAYAIFILKEEINRDDLKKIKNIPIFINSVINTLDAFNLPNISRFNGWHGFIKNNVWEVATKEEAIVSQVFKTLNWEVCFVKDKPGLVSARIIAMIINEAYYAYEDGISTKDEIDIAMKLGTNYPYGPFEWSSKIGLQKIYNLLSRLSENDLRYKISGAMQKEIQE